MTAAEMRALRERQGWSQTKLAEHLNVILDRKYTSSTVSKWEKDKLAIPAGVNSILEEIVIQTAPAREIPDQDVSYELPDQPPGMPGDDSAPPPPPGRGAEPTGVNLAPTGGDFDRICTELFELVATGVGVVGSALGSKSLQRDGVIIHEDKRELGKAYAKLARTNETFRRMLTGMTTSGAWLEVALVTGMTGGKIMRNHQLAAAPVVAPPVEEPEGVEFSGDGTVVSYPHLAG